MVRPHRSEPVPEDYINIMEKSINELLEEFNKPKARQDKYKINIAVEVIRINLLDKFNLRIARFQPNHYTLLKQKVDAIKVKNLKKYKQIMKMIKKSETLTDYIRRNDPRQYESSSSSSSNSTNSSSSRTVAGGSRSKRTTKRKGTMRKGTMRKVMKKGTTRKRL